MSQQQFDWKHSPANDLRRALQQAQLSLKEMSENKFLESSLRDLLKHRIAPAYYMQIYQTPIRKIHIQLNELWKHAALPTKHAYSETGNGHHVLNVNSAKPTSDDGLNEDHKQPLWDQRTLQQIIQQLQEISSELQKVKDNVSTKMQARKIVDKLNMNCKRESSQIRCYQCNDLGHVAKYCRDNNQTSNRGKINPFFRGRGRETSPFRTDQFGKYQSAQYADVDFDMDQNGNHRWDDDSKTDTYFKEDLEEIYNIRLDSSEDNADEGTHQFRKFKKT